MRTTLSIDEDVLRAVNVLAAAQGRSIGSILSELARKGLKPSAAVAYRDDFPVFDVDENSTVFGAEEVRRALDDEQVIALLDVDMRVALAWANHIHHEGAHRQFAEYREPGETGQQADDGEHGWAIRRGGRLVTFDRGILQLVGGSRDPRSVVELIG